MSMLADAWLAHARRCSRAAGALRALADGRMPRLEKPTSNLFRDRAPRRGRALDLGDFTHVIAIDPRAGWVDAEGGISYEALVDATLALGVMPTVVPQLRTITVGGAVAGVGIEASSFREGLVHHTMLELDVLLPSGEIVLCTPDNEHRELFFGFPNSYGTLGYALRVRLRTRPVKPFVRILHERLDGPVRFFETLARRLDASGPDFLDGVVFDPGLPVLTTASFADDVGDEPSDYGFENIYWHSLRERRSDGLRVRDWLWRWDTDWFWCSRHFGAEHALVRRLLGRSRLNSRTWQQLMRWNARWGFTRRWARLRGWQPESVIQDVDIPLPQAGDFLEFLLREIGIVPVWICPVRVPGSAPVSPLYPLAPGRTYVNFGFWDVVRRREPHEAGHFNRLVEREVIRLGGIKSLYSDSFFTRDEFATAYGGEAYARLKDRYDPQRRLFGLYEKCVLRA